ncbi:hypothetical protein PybrP1_008484 [[Pythium] brassicae (nom. inval.)]|nr:hypothetical protein PybrP1_008484 [[Pythium] brassicae (nom. inval.)]
MAAAVDAGSQEASAAATTDSIRSRKTPFASTRLTLLSITMADVVAAVNKVQRSTKREGISTTPDTTWAAIGVLASVREELVLTAWWLRRSEVDFFYNSDALLLKQLAAGTESVLDVRVLQCDPELMGNAWHVRAMVCARSGSNAKCHV